MGTRHIIKVRKNGRDWISQYGQWDGYPTGQGVTVMEFVNSPYLSYLERNIDDGLITPVSVEEYEERIRNFVGWSEGNPVLKAMFEQMFATSVFCRDAGAKCLMMFAKRIGQCVAVINEPSGWEEYMYTVDYDKRTVTIQELSGSCRSKEYTFDEVKTWDEDSTEAEMERLENEWSEE